MSDKTIVKLVEISVLGCTWILSTAIAAYAIDITKDVNSLWVMTVPLIVHIMCVIIDDFR